VNFSHLLCYTISLETATAPGRDKRTAAWVLGGKRLAISEPEGAQRGWGSLREARIAFRISDMFGQSWRGQSWEAGLKSFSRFFERTGCFGIIVYLPGTYL
jgi:hypothetical protein